MKTLAILVLYLSLHSVSNAQYCTQDDRFTESEYFSLLEVDSITNIVYGNAIDYQGNQTSLLLDVYFPKSSADQLTERPLVLMIHGGGFLAGNKNDRKIECLALAQRGYVAATMNYRLGWNTGIPSDQVVAMYRAHQDAHAALRFLTFNQGNYGIDTNWMFVGGSSAGAITSNNVVYTDQSEWNAYYPGIETTLGSIDTSGNSYTNTFELNGIFNNWGAVPLGAMQMDEMIPQIAFHGELDPTVDIDTAAFLMGSRSIHYTLLENGVCSDITVDPSGLHGIYTNLQGAIFRASKASCFFRSVFCENCSDVYTTDSIPAACSSTIGLHELPSDNRKVVRIIDLMGRETEDKPNTLLIYVYSDGTKEKVYRVE